jgi:hypothetical protein
MPAPENNPQHPMAETPKAVTRNALDPRAKNAIRHGLTAGALPPGCGYVKRIIGEFRTSLEASVIEVHGSIDLYRAGVIQTALRLERHALLCQRWLRKGEGTLTPDQRLAYSRDIGKASAERDKCLRELGINAKAASDPWADLDATATTKPAQLANATEGGQA